MWSRNHIDTSRTLPTKSEDRRKGVSVGLPPKFSDGIASPDVLSPRSSRKPSFGFSFSRFSRERTDLDTFNHQTGGLYSQIESKEKSTNSLTFFVSSPLGGREAGKLDETRRFWTLKLR